jgi:cysteinyl-tRNA synthetase
MKHPLSLYNSLTRKKEQFIPLHSPFVGMYVCGPTVYSEPHLGHVRMAITYDVLYRYLLNLSYKVRYIRNITDVGHLEDELSGQGEDRISKKARIEQLEPMEIVQKYKLEFQHVLEKLNTLPPSIEPQASGHIIEQQQMIRSIMENGYAYEVNGSVYFDIESYNRKFQYGKLSGRKIEDMLSNTRDLEGQIEKRNPLDFALWKKASPEHIMHWPSEWSEGFPGWHLECSAMSTKYLGKTFDIHGGGMDLLFPHHECEIAQSVAANGKEHVRYWIHNNMITIDGQKMARSLNNFITLRELFSGNHPKLTQAYSPMNIRFFILQAHYRSTLDFSNDALQAADKGLKRLMNSLIQVEKIIPQKGKSSFSVEKLIKQFENAMNDDLNTSVAIAVLFGVSDKIASVINGKMKITKSKLDDLKKFLNKAVYEILGLKEEQKQLRESSHEEALLDIIVNHLRQEARKNKDFKTSDALRNQLAAIGITLNDTKEGTTWEIN